MSVVVDVAICTFRRPSVVQTLASLARQTLPAGHALRRHGPAMQRQLPGGGAALRSGTDHAERNFLRLPVAVRA